MSDFWKGWWWNELTQPVKQPYIPDVQFEDPYAGLTPTEKDAAISEQALEYWRARERGYREGVQADYEMAILERLEK